MSPSPLSSGRLDFAPRSPISQRRFASLATSPRSQSTPPPHAFRSPPPPLSHPANLQYDQSTFSAVDDDSTPLTPTPSSPSKQPISASQVSSRSSTSSQAPTSGSPTSSNASVALPSEVYSGLVAEGAIEHDAGQIAALKHLDELHRKLHVLADTPHPGASKSPGVRI